MATAKKAPERIGKKMIESLQGVVKTLKEQGIEGVSKKFTVRQVKRTKK